MRYILRYELFSLIIFSIYIIYGSENWTLTASQRRRIEGEEMKLLRPLAGYILYDHKTNNSLRHELQTECILDKIDEYRRNWFYTYKNAPKPNPFEITSLQTTRKKNNWKTEETLARIVVTLEKERMFMMFMMMMMMINFCLP
jgi:hypothetical protein